MNEHWKCVYINIEWNQKSAGFEPKSSRTITLISIPQQTFVSCKILLYFLKNYMAHIGDRYRDLWVTRRALNTPRQFVLIETWIQNLEWTKARITMDNGLTCVFVSVSWSFFLFFCFLPSVRLSDTKVLIYHILHIRLGITFLMFRKFFNKCMF